MTSRLLTGSARLAGAPLLALQSDSRLLALARAGHDDAFAAIVHRYRTPLLRYCDRLVGRSRAEDGVQQAFIYAYNAMTTSEREIELRPWLYRIAHNASINILRASAPPAPDAVAETAAAVATEELAELRERLRRTLDAIDALPDGQRDAIVLHAVEGRTHEQVAAALGVTEGAARQALHRARTTLRAAVSAVTPYPLLVKLMTLGTGSGGAARWVDAAAGLGFGGVAVKLGAGVAATAVIAGGAFEGGLIERHEAARPAAKERRVAPRPSGAAATARPAAAAAPAASAGAKDKSDAFAEPKRRGRDRDRRGNGDGDDFERLGRFGRPPPRELSGGPPPRRRSGPGPDGERTRLDGQRERDGAGPAPYSGSGPGPGPGAQPGATTPYPPPDQDPREQQPAPEQQPPPPSRPPAERTLDARAAPAPSAPAPLADIEGR